MLRRSPAADRRARRPRGGGHGSRPIAVLAEVVALGLSVAANLAAVWHDGAEQVWAAGALPLVLILATYLFLAHRVPVVWSLGKSGGWAWWANVVAGVAILVPAAMASYWHQRELLLGPDGEGVPSGAGGALVDLVGTPVLLATLLPLTVDGLAVRAALTLWSRTERGAAPAAKLEPWGPPTAVSLTKPTPQVLVSPKPTPPSPGTTPARPRAATPRPPKLAPVPAAPAGPAVGRKLSSTQRLRAQAKARGITQKGKKDSDLRAEIAAHDAREQVPA